MHRHFTAAVAFLGWTLSSLLCHWSAKTFLDLHGNESCFDVIQSSLLLTLLQVSTCFLVLRFDVGDAVKPALLLLAAHSSASFCTNTSFLFVATSQSLAVKSTEPLTTAALLSLIAWKLPSKLTSISLCVVMTGVLGFVGGSASVGMGSSLALFSNVFFGLRNINKRQIGSEWKVELLPATEITVNAVCVSLMAVFFTQKGPAANYLICSALMHVVYTYISTCIILKYLTVVEHAVANITKRVLIVVAFALIPGHHHIQTTNWLWLGVSLCGFAVYCYKRKVLGVDETHGISNIVRKVASIFLFTFILLLGLMLYTSDCSTLTTTTHTTNGTQNPFGTRIQEYQQHNDRTLRTILGKGERVVYYNIPVQRSYTDAMQSLGLTRALEMMEIKIAARCFDVRCLSAVDVQTFDIIAKQNSEINNLCARFKKSKIIVLLEGNETAFEMADCRNRIFFITHATDAPLNAVYSPSLAFSIGAVDPFMPPMYDVLLDLPKTFNCDVFNMAGLHCALSHHSSWKIATVTDHREYETIHSYGIMMHVLRAKVVITDSMTSHVAALLLGIPHVLLGNEQFESDWEKWSKDDLIVRVGNITDEVVLKVVQMARNKGRARAVGMEAAQEMWNLQCPDF